MSTPDKMDCIGPECPSPLNCSGLGYCRARKNAGAKEYEAALAACRAAGITDPFARKDAAA